MPTKPKPVEESTPFPKNAPLSLPIPTLSAEERNALGTSAWNNLRWARGARSRYDDALDLWNAIYEMRSRPKNSPWPGAANFVSPDITSRTEELVSRVCGAIFQERLFTVRGNDPIAGQFAHSVEQFYNDKSYDNDWPSAFESTFQLGSRDGTGVTEILWDQRTHQETRLVLQPDGSRVPKVLTIVDYDDPKLQAVEMRDFVLIPAYAPSIEAADAVARKVYMTEADMWKMVNAGIFNANDVEAILSYKQPGGSDLPQDPQGTKTYTISGLIDVSDNTVAPPEGIRVQRGPVELWRVHTRQYDLNKDGVFEENILWIHETSGILAGVAPFEYWGGRPFKSWSPFPRQNRFYGQGVPQRLKSMGEEKNAQRNSLYNWLDLATAPMRWRTKNTDFTKGQAYGPNAEVVVQGKDDFGFYTLGDPPQSVLVAEEKIESDMDRAVGGVMTPAAQAPVGGTQQRSARAVQVEMAIRSQMMNTLIRSGRKHILECFKYAHGLYQQYGEDQFSVVDNRGPSPKQVVIPREVLSLDYTLGIVGLGGPLDKEQRRQDMLMLYQILAPTPLIGQNIPRLWNLLRMLLETFDVPEVTQIIGSLEDAQNQQQQMAQAAEAQQKQQMLLAVLQHRNNTQPGGSAQRKPAQPGAQPQQPMMGAFGAAA